MKVLSNFENFQYQNRNLKNGRFLQKLKKAVRIVLYGPAISQSDCRKAGPYQSSSNNIIILITNSLIRGTISCGLLRWELEMHITFENRL